MPREAKLGRRIAATAPMMHESEGLLGYMWQRGKFAEGKGTDREVALALLFRIFFENRRLIVVITSIKTNNCNPTHVQIRFWIIIYLEFLKII